MGLLLIIIIHIDTPAPAKSINDWAKAIEAAKIQNLIVQANNLFKFRKLTYWFENV